MLTQDAGDFIQLPDFNVTTNTFTVMAWIKPSGTQSDYSSIVMNDGTAAGLNFREGNNTLGYHWSNGGQWFWDSNLEVPEGVWSHVAMTADPSGVSLYLNGIEARHNIGLSPIDMTTFKIGSYQGWNSRNYRGEIEELSIWNRSLTTEEIRLLRHLTLEDVINDPDLLAYYQFNDDLNLEMDKARSHHGVLNGNTDRMPSYVPIGSGVSMAQNINAAGNYIFGGTGVELQFPGIGTLPNGSIIATRINGLPHAQTNNNENLGSYFILNNYGSQSFTDVYDIKWDDAFSSPSQIVVNNPDWVRLYNRTANSDIEPWVNLCNMSSVMNQHYSFINNANCTSPLMGQYFLNACGDSAVLTTDYGDGEEIEINVTQFIEAYNTIFSGAKVIYSASGHTELKPQFEVKLGARLDILTEGCEN